jgi:hypothetical protein
VQQGTVPAAIDHVRKLLAISLKRMHFEHGQIASIHEDLCMNENELPVEPARTRPYRISSAQWSLVGITLALAVAAVLYRVLVLGRLEQTAGLFIGLPTVIAIILALTPRAKSVTGLILRGTTIALLLSGPLLGEGFICILMAAPLFYLVGAVVGLIIDNQRKKSQRLYAVVLLPLLLSSLEGTTPALTFPKRERVTVTKSIAMSAAALEEALAHPPRFAGPMPRFLRLRFPLPVESRGEGLTNGAPRVIHFAGGEGKPGDLTLRVADRGPGAVTFETVSDKSKVAHWLTWRASRVTWRPLRGDRTEVTWTIVYDRELAPAWYFGPWEHYATRLAADYLIDSVAAARKSP